MKRYCTFGLTTFLAVLLLGISFGQDQKANRVTISEGVLSWNEKRIDLPANPQEIIDLLGKPNRETKLANTILTWDKLGIYVYVDSKIGKVRSIHIGLRKEPFAFAPKVPFAGVLTVDGARITAESSIAQINNATKKKPFKMAFAETSNWWKAVYERKMVYIETVDDDGKGITFLAVESKLSR